MPFFLHPMFFPSMWLGTVLVVMALMLPTVPKRECVILKFPEKKRPCKNPKYVI